MFLGQIMSRLEDEHDAASALEALEDIVLLTDVQQMCARYDETPGQYASGAARRFAAGASHEDWLALVTALDAAANPAQAALAKMVRWSLGRDAADAKAATSAEAAPSCSSGCTCGGGSGHGGHAYAPT